MIDEVGAASPRTALVVGGEGFVGSAIVRALRARGVTATPLGRGQRLPETRFNVVFDANGNPRRYLAEQDPERDYTANVACVFDRVARLQADRYVLISSVDVYAHGDDRDQTHETVTVRPEALSNYGRHKALAEAHVLRHARSPLVLRLAQMVGPGLGKGPLYDLLHELPSRVTDDSCFPFLHVDTVAEIACALSTTAREGIYNVCGRGSLTMEDARRMVNAVSGKRDRVPHEAARERRQYRIDTRRVARYVDVPSSATEVERYLRTLAAQASA